MGLHCSTAARHGEIEGKKVQSLAEGWYDRLFIYKAFAQGPFTAMRQDKGWAEQDIHSSGDGPSFLSSRPLSRRKKAPLIVLIRVDRLYNTEQ